VDSSFASFWLQELLGTGLEFTNPTTGLFDTNGTATGLWMTQRVITVNNQNDKPTKQSKQFSMAYNETPSLGNFWTSAVDSELQ
jgi:hypothetical protein